MHNQCCPKAWMFHFLVAPRDIMEIAKLQDDNKALDRSTKSKEAALLEAERSVQVVVAKASMVDDLQNMNQELMKQIEICQEERKTLDRELARTKVTANRVAAVVANEWKDANDKVMPVKQWIEERSTLTNGTVCIRKSLLIAAEESKVSLKDGSESSNLLRGTKKQVRVRFSFLH
ncbi:hypothetical protein C3L33_23302, partial [Rhododendron williamsianum]